MLSFDICTFCEFPRKVISCEKYSNNRLYIYIISIYLYLYLYIYIPPIYIVVYVYKTERIWRTRFILKSALLISCLSS